MAARRPNLILVMTDDQGYGDLGCTGNPWVQTPNIDEFFISATRCSDFHVSPLCTPTRGAIMSGRNPLRNGAWATCWGRSILRRDETTMADVFTHNGYRTGMFGKWHLGDNYPYRPQDRGFAKVVAHRGGGVGQTPDFWGNSYFDDTYLHNGKPVAHEGYCTDVWFGEAMSFIEQSRDEPFFCYLATNAPHSPYLVADEYADLYRGNPDIPEPEFYGMITNIDENFGRLVKQLDALELAEDTILIFMTDNGSSGGFVPETGAGYNAGMRGKKGSYYDGGHRVPFFIRWPGGGIGGMRDVREMVTHTDLLPTFIELCGLDEPEHRPFDGMSVAPLLRGERMALPDREVFLQYRQNTDPPRMWENAVMTRDWRLVGGEELYHVSSDPGQVSDVAARYPDIARRLRIAHERWWAEVEPLLEQYCPISIGAEEENPACLGAMDVLGDVAWNQGHIRDAMRSTGCWAVEVERAGHYRFELRRWPRELGLPIDGVLQQAASSAIHPSRARIGIGGFEAVADVPAGAEAVVFEADLQPGRADLDAWFIDADGEERGAYYVYAERV
ncbi:MAG TPA: Cerebroside-sulfatase [Armatimonadetes bacterium]|nr:Cerebroside-sulfatase [Armatimonadota bacterium]